MKPAIRVRATAARVIGAALAVGLAGTAWGACGPVPKPGPGRFGPFDYRTNKDKLQEVESFHFTPQVEALVRGASTTIGGDLHYTLDKFPNHHRALLATMRMAARSKTGTVQSMEPVECYFERAVLFRQDDTVVRTMYAMYLGGLGRKDDAVRQLEAARQHADDNPFTHQSIGLVYLDLGLIDRAVFHAQEAQRLGLTQSELVNRLKAVGRWNPEPPPVPGDPAASPPASPASAAASAATN